LILFFKKTKSLSYIFTQIFKKLIWNKHASSSACGNVPLKNDMLLCTAFLIYVSLAVTSTDKTSSVTFFFFPLENNGGRIYGLTDRKLGANCGLIDVTILDFL